MQTVYQYIFIVQNIILLHWRTCRWRGTYTEIVKEVLKHVNFDLKDLHVVIGPSTSSSYEINDDIKNKFETLPIDSANYIETRGRDRHGIDLKSQC